MKLSYKTIAILLLISAAVMLIILKNDDDVEYIKTIGITISINLISSIIIIYLIDFKKEDNVKKELEEKRKIVYKQLFLPLKEFDELILNMYKSTVSYNEMKHLTYNIENIDLILENIKLIDLTKESYMGNLDFTTQKWQETILKQLLKFIKNIADFYENNYYILTNELSENLNNIAHINSNENIFNLLLLFPVNLKMIDLLKIINFNILLTSTFNIKNEISDYYEDDPFEIDKTKFLRDDITPKFKSGLEDEN